MPKVHSVDVCSESNSLNAVSFRCESFARCGIVISEIVTSLISVAMATAGRTGLQRSYHVTSPCHPNPCDVTQICDVIRRHQRHRCTSSRDCRRFVCKPGTCLLIYD